MYEHVPENPYLLLTPGPLSTSAGVRDAMLRDWCTWDSDYNQGVVQRIRRQLVELATTQVDDYSAVLLQGSGTFSVEATIGSAVPREGRLLVIENGAYGARMLQIAEVLGISACVYRVPESEVPDARRVCQLLADDPHITHVALVHCETTTGILNPLAALAEVVKAAGKVLIVDAMSTFAGIRFDAGELGIDYLVSSANKCIQGVPGFAFVIARRAELQNCQHHARSLSLDLYAQWQDMDKDGKWRFTSPTHVVRACAQALDELAAEGGVAARQARYTENQRRLAEGMERLGFIPLIDRRWQSPIITAFLYPDDRFDFAEFYEQVKARGFVLYPGKISQAQTFRIGNIGEVYATDIDRLLLVIADVRGAENFA